MKNWKSLRTDELSRRQGNGKFLFCTAVSPWFTAEMTCCVLLCLVVPCPSFLFINRLSILKWIEVFFSIEYGSAKTCSVLADHGCVPNIIKWLLTSLCKKIGHRNGNHIITRAKLTQDSFPRVNFAGSGDDGNLVVRSKLSLDDVQGWYGNGANIDSQDASP